jgi:uncharacterized protein (TIGR03067 family)
MRSKQPLARVAGVGLLAVLLAGWLSQTGSTCSIAAQGEGQQAAKKELLRFQGTWIVHKEISRGKDFPADKERRVVIDMAAMKMYEEGKLVVTLSFHIDPTKSPAAIDLVSPGKGDQKGPVVPGIYQFEGDLLKIATGFGREERKTRPKSFEDKSGLFLLILKKAESKAK